jgi:hypothetical protein
MKRCDFLRGLCAATCAARARGLARPARRGLGRKIAAEPAADRALEIGLGPQLFLDDYLIDRRDGLARRVQSPKRQRVPVLDSKDFGTTQPYLTVLRDGDAGTFRIWYNHGPALWHAESADGVRWAKARVAWDLPRNYAANLVDDQGRESHPDRRYKLADWQATRSKEDKDGDDKGMCVAFSQDGLRCTAHLGDPDARPVAEDVLAGDVSWPRPLAGLQGKPVRLEVRVRRADLFGLTFHAK